MRLYTCPTNFTHYDTPLILNVFLLREFSVELPVVYEAIRMQERNLLELLCRNGNRTDVMDVEKPNGVTHLSFYFRFSYSSGPLNNFTFGLVFDEYDPPY